jgi:hypothetical protein
LQIYTVKIEPAVPLPEQLGLIVKRIVIGTGSAIRLTSSDCQTVHQTEKNSKSVSQLLIGMQLEYMSHDKERRTRHVLTVI